MRIPCIVTIVLAKKGFVTNDALGCMFACPSDPLSHFSSSSVLLVLQYAEMCVSMSMSVCVRERERKREREREMGTEIMY